MPVVALAPAPALMGIRKVKMGLKICQIDTNMDVTELM
jgi:hypothetical protein